MTTGLDIEAAVKRGPTSLFFRLRQAGYISDCCERRDRVRAETQGALILQPSLTFPMSRGLAR